jgi:hypothetical protein
MQPPHTVNLIIQEKLKKVWYVAFVRLHRLLKNFSFLLPIDKNNRSCINNTLKNIKYSRIYIVRWVTSGEKTLLTSNTVTILDRSAGLRNQICAKTCASAWYPYMEVFSTNSTYLPAETQTHEVNNRHKNQSIKQHIHSNL